MAESSVSEFEAYRSLLFSIAYRMTGSAADAEDLVQDAWIRFASADREVVRDVKAFLVTILTRLALDRLKSAQKQRETYIGPWLPEPVVTKGEGDPLAIEFALLTAMERLSPQERAVLLLADVLDHDHSEIAELLDISPAASRQTLHRARERVAEGKKRFAPPRADQERLIQTFLSAVRDGDVGALRRTLAEDVVARADGGGKVPGAGLHPIHGVDSVTRLWLGLAKKFPPGMVVRLVDANGAPAAAAFVGDQLLSLVVFDFEGDHIAGITSVVNPDKLRFANRQLAS